MQEEEAGAPDQRCAEARGAGSVERRGPAAQAPAPRGELPSETSTGRGRAQPGNGGLGGLILPPGSGPPGLSGAASLRARDGARKPRRRRGGTREGGVSPLRRDTAPDGGKGLSRERGQRERGAPRSPAPAAEPDASRETGRLEQRRGPGPSDGCAVFGEREHETSLVEFIFLILNFYLFIYFYLKGSR